ncbi:MAG: sulfatase-like hydrolase/transferase [Bacteroidetes bacterium]|nr:sulfatase-like hydrolase/transferase [Bacteroidota bacterium]
MVKKFILYYLKQFLFWMVLFQVCRLVFYLYNFSSLKDAVFTEVLLSFWHAIYIDLSATSYVMVIPFIIIFFQTLIKSKIPGIINDYYSYFIVFLVSLITAADLGIYEEWRVKLNYKAISYLAQPDEAYKSTGTSTIILGLLFIIIFSFLGIYLYRKLVKTKIEFEKRNFIFSVLFLGALPFLLLGGIRGGTQQIPITQSVVYFSKNNFINIATVNTSWNIIYSIQKNRKYLNENPYKYFTLKEARAEVDSLFYVKKDTTVNILTTKRPNIVLMIMESWSADLVKSCFGYEGITPQFEKLTKEGLIFNNFYASGELSDQGICAILSGFPAQPTTSIINQEDKYQKLPCVTKKLQKLGYYTSFYFGGQLNYGNIKGYIYYNDLDRIIEGKDFSSSIPRGSLGVHDEFLYKQLITDYRSFKQPFFASAFTLSSHSPFDQPMNQVFDWGGEYRTFINSVYYADKSLGKFIQDAKKEKWYDNTLFVVMADHSHPTPKNRSYWAREYRQIPLLIFGNALKPEYRGKKYEKVASQTDFAATLLSQMQIDHKEFKWSRDLFNPNSKEFAFYSSKYGFGWVEAKNYYSFLHDGNKYYDEKFETPQSQQKAIKRGKSFLEVLFQDYLDY